MRGQTGTMALALLCAGAAPCGAVAQEASPEAPAGCFRVLQRAGEGGEPTMLGSMVEFLLVEDDGKDAGWSVPDAPRYWRPDEDPRPRKRPAVRPHLPSFGLVRAVGDSLAAVWLESRTVYRLRLGAGDERLAGPGVAVDLTTGDSLAAQFALIPVDCAL